MASSIRPTIGPAHITGWLEARPGEVYLIVEQLVLVLPEGERERRIFHAHIHHAEATTIGTTPMTPGAAAEIPMTPRAAAAEVHMAEAVEPGQPAVESQAPAAEAVASAMVMVAEAAEAAEAAQAAPAADAQPAQKRQRTG